MQAIYFYHEQPITSQHIQNAICKAGVSKGDIVYLHSDVGTIGRLGDLKNRDDFFEAILQSFLDVIGEEGTLIVPTFTYSFCKGEIFDVKNSKSTVGAFTEWMRRHPKIIRSEDAIFSHAALGRNAEKLMRNVGSVCFGKDSVFERLYRYGAKIIVYGKEFETTYIHYVETQNNVDYRYVKKFSGQIRHDDGTLTDHEFDYLVRRVPEETGGGDVVYDLAAQTKIYTELGAMKSVPLGGQWIHVVDARLMADKTTDLLKTNPYVLLKKNPYVT